MLFASKSCPLLSEPRPPAPWRNNKIGYFLFLSSLFGERYRYFINPPSLLSQTVDEYSSISSLTEQEINKIIGISIRFIIFSLI